MRDDITVTFQNQQKLEAEVAEKVKNCEAYFPLFPNVCINGVLIDFTAKELALNGVVDAQILLVKLAVKESQLNYGQEIKKLQNDIDAKVKASQEELVKCRQS